MSIMRTHPASMGGGVKDWSLFISVTLGLTITAAALIWSAYDSPTGGLSPSDFRSRSGSAPSLSPDIPRAAQGNPRPAAGQAPPSPHLDPLFSALAISQPVEPPEAQDFALLDMEGQPVRLRALQGKFIFVNFWATWCAPCRLEMPSIEQLYQTFKQTEFTVLAISIDRQGAPVVKPFLASLKLTFPALLDTTNEVARQYGLRGLPTTYLIDPDGRVIGAAIGERNWSSTEAKALIAGLLRHAAARPSDPEPHLRPDGR